VNVRAVPWLIAAALVVADRLTKIAVVSHIQPGDVIRVFPGLTLTHVRNPGIAFSLFSGGDPASRWILYAVIVAAVAVLAWMTARHGDTSSLAPWALGLVLGGAVGNLIDRVLYDGSVVDFTRVWVNLGGRTYSWPDFNVADSAITVGAALLILNEIRLGRRRRNSGEPDASGTD